MAIFSFPRIIYYGFDAIEMLPEYIKNNGLKRGLIVTDQNMVKLGYLDILKRELEKTPVEYKVYDGVEEEPSFDTAMEIGRLAISYGPDFLIALGGGSVIDAAKGGWVAYERPDFDIQGVSPFEWLGLGRKAILISIPTTSGTGSEATLGMVLSEVNGGKRKIALGSYELVSSIIVLDPIFPMGMPKNLTLSTGLDVLAHSLEAYVSNTSSPFTDALSLESIKIVLKYLPISIVEPNNKDAREMMHMAAWMAGTAFSNSGLGLGHAIAHAMGPKFSLPHGLSVGISLPYVIRFNYQDERTRDKYDYILAHLKMDNLLDGETIYDALLGFYNKIGAPISLSGLVDEELYTRFRDEVVDEAMMDPDVVFNPVPVTDVEIREVLDNMFNGAI